MSASEPVCLACGGTPDELWTTASDSEYGTTTERFEYHRCADCDCLSIFPVPLDRLEQIYPPTYYAFVSSNARGGPVARIKERLDVRSFRRATELIGNRAPRILDVGGGTGSIAEKFIRATGGHATATVVDLDPDSIAIARDRGLQGFAGRIEDFEADRPFDLVLMLNLVEHVVDPIGVMCKARELLAPGGFVWLQTPNFRSLDERIYRRRNWAGYHCPRHWAIFSEEGLRRGLDRAGLEPVRFDRTQGGPFWAGSLLGLRRAGRLRKTRDLGQPGAPVARADLPPALTDSAAFMPLAALGAAFDMATRRFRPVSQISVMARPRT